MLTLGDVLNAFDGIPERVGQIIIFDTNDVDILGKLDPAFKRRIDRKILWKTLSGENCKLFLQVRLGWCDCCFVESRCVC